MKNNNFPKSYINILFIFIKHIYKSHAKKVRTFNRRTIQKINSI